MKQARHMNWFEFNLVINSTMSLNNMSQKVKAHTVYMYLTLFAIGH